MSSTVVPILELNEKSFKIDAPAFKSILAKVGNKPFAIISINGATRTGKSYILNHFVRYFECKKHHPETTDWYNQEAASSFKWRGGRERETVGINLWPEPYFVTTPAGEEIAVLLMDTQGLFDEQTTARQNAIIFSISTLCSSAMIFNIMRLIDDNILQQVEFFSGYANMAPVYEDVDEESTEESSSSSSTGSGNSSKLTFLIRDFDVAEYEYGHHSEFKKPEGSDQNYYRDTFLIENRSDRPEENKVVRKNILRNFSSVSTYCLPDPGKEFKRPTGSGEGKPDEEFQEYVIRFVEEMVAPKNLVKKTVFGQPTTGIEFQKYVDNWAKLCGKAEKLFPDVRTMAENTAFTQYSMALNLAVSKYKNDIDKFIKEKRGSATSDDLETVHLDIAKQAREMFAKSQRMRNDKFEEEYSEKLEESIEMCYEYAKNNNDMYRDAAARASENEEMFKKMMEDMQRRMDEERVRMDGIVRGYQETTTRLTNNITEQQRQLETIVSQNHAAQQQLANQIVSLSNRPPPAPPVVVKRRGCVIS